MVLPNSVSDKYKHECYQIAICYIVIPPPYTLPSSHQVIAKADSGASRNYFTMNDKHVLTSVKHVTRGPQVNLPNGVEVQALETGQIPLYTSLSKQTTIAHFFQNSLVHLLYLSDNYVMTAALRS